MPGSDRPVVVLVEPQLGENIGAAARAMLNFGLDEMRLVSPRDDWPNHQAINTSSGAERVLEAATLYNATEDAVADLNYIVATTRQTYSNRTTNPATSTDNCNGLSH